jgi:hypothetical protein
VQSNFSRMFDQFLFKHNFVSAFPHRPTDCSKTEWWIAFPFGIRLCIHCLYCCIVVGIVFVPKHAPTTPRHIWQHYIERIDGLLFQLDCKTYIMDCQSISSSPCYLWLVQHCFRATKWRFWLCKESWIFQMCWKWNPLSSFVRWSYTNLIVNFPFPPHFHLITSSLMLNP